jgi:hypothetical protein
MSIGIEMITDLLNNIDISQIANIGQKIMPDKASKYFKVPVRQFYPRRAPNDPNSNDVRTKYVISLAIQPNSFSSLCGVRNVDIMQIL